jgi:23S rRNA (pseudouridine1915-N3)-methyltransferase
MLSVRVVAVGKVRTPGLASAIEEYENRLRHYVRFEAVAVAASTKPEEGAALLRRIPESDVLVALTRGGESWTTRTMAENIDEIQTFGGGALSFAIGGAHGLDRAVLERARFRVSLSPMTLPHELARLVLTEQLYRVGTLLRGEPYHKGP